MIFKDLWVLIFIPALLIIIFFLRRYEAEPGFIFPSDENLKAQPPSARSRLAGGLVWLRYACLILLVIALARPQLSREIKVRRDAVAVILATDCSSTMLAEDLGLGPTGMARLVESPDGEKRLSRLDAVKDVARDFIRSRPEDLVGLVVFAAEAFIASPLTFDHEWLAQSLDRVKVGLIKDGTAIGSGIMSSLTSLKDTDAKSRVIILLSDGINNAGTIPPLVAAKAARAVGVKIYTVGIVSRGQTPFPVIDASGRKTYKDVRIDVNETVLKKIAEATGGQFFRATDLATLRKAYEEIDKLEKVSMEERTYAEHEDIFGWFVLAALLCLLAQIVLGNTILRKVP